MATLWTKWFLLFVEEKKLNTANLLAAEWDPDDGSTTFGSVKLSTDGQEPVSHYGCSTPATVTMRDGITAALGALSWAAMYWTDEVYAEPAVWVGPDGWRFEGPAGDVYPAWLAALADMGLQRVQEDPFLAAGVDSGGGESEGIGKKVARRLGRYRANR